MIYCSGDSVTCFYYTQQHKNTHIKKKLSIRIKVYFRSRKAAATTTSIIIDIHIKQTIIAQICAPHIFYIYFKHFSFKLFLFTFIICSRKCELYKKNFKYTQLHSNADIWFYFCFVSSFSTAWFHSFKIFLLLLFLRW